MFSVLFVIAKIAAIVSVVVFFPAIIVSYVCKDYLDVLPYKIERRLVEDGRIDVDQAVSDFISDVENGRMPKLSPLVWQEIKENEKAQLAKKVHETARPLAASSLFVLVLAIIAMPFLND